VITGSCHCGAVKYEIHGQFLMFAYCHCPDCRKYSGSAFSSILGTESAGFKIVVGEDRLIEYQSSPGKHRFFCGTCGCRIYLRAEHRPGMVFVRAGSLDDDPHIKPQAHYWTSARAPWHDITDSLPQFPEGLPSQGLAPKPEAQQTAGGDGEPAPQP